MSERSKSFLNSDKLEALKKKTQTAAKLNTLFQEIESITSRRQTIEKEDIMKQVEIPRPKSVLTGHNSVYRIQSTVN